MKTANPQPQTQPKPSPANVLMTSGGILIQAPPCASVPSPGSSTAPAPTTQRR